MFFTKKRKKEIEKMKERMSNIEKGILSLNKKIEKYDDMLRDYETFSIEKQLAKQSNEPWVGISSAGVESDGRVKLAIDWNENFVEYLRKNGINADNEEDLVSFWFSSLIKEWGEEIDEEQAKKYER